MRPALPAIALGLTATAGAAQVLPAAATFKDLVISTAANGDALVKFAGNTIDIAGVSAASLRPADFLFNQNNPALASLCPPDLR